MVPATEISKRHYEIVLDARSIVDEQLILECYYTHYEGTRTQHCNVPKARHDRN